MVEWYRGPTLAHMINQSNQFLPPLTLPQVFAKPSYVRFKEPSTRLFITTGNHTKSIIITLKR